MLQLRRSSRLARMENTAFNIPIIIKEISRYLSYEEVKQARLINKEWNTTMIPVMTRRKTRLRIPMLLSKDYHHAHYLRHDCIDTLYENIDKRLLSHVLLHPLPMCTTIIEEYTTVEDFLKTRQSHIQFIDVLMCQKFMNYYCRIFATIHFPFLKQIRIIDRVDMPEGYDMCFHNTPRPLTLIFPKRRVLKSVKCDMQSYGSFDRDILYFVCALIYCAGPALEELDLHLAGRLLPSFHTCVSLKKLHLSFVEQEDKDIVDFPMERLIKLLSGVKDTLEELHLRNHSWPTFSRDEEITVLQFPLFKNLKILSLPALDLYDVSHEINSNLLPKVEKLTLGAKSKYGLEDFIEALPDDKCLNTVTELTMIGTLDEASFERARKIFPNVKSLVVITEDKSEMEREDDDESVVESVDDDENLEEINNIEDNNDVILEDEDEYVLNIIEKLALLFDELRKWKLQKLVLIARNCTDVFDVFYALPYYRFDGLEVFKVFLPTLSVEDKIARDECQPFSRVPDEIKTPMLRTKGVKIFEISQEDMMPSETKLIEEFAADNGLVISFHEPKVFDDEDYEHILS